MMLPAVAAEEERGGEITLDKPPAELRTTALLEFLSERNSVTFPKTVEDWVRELELVDFAPVRMLIPRGRSAQAGNTDEENPRIVAAPTAANKIASRPPFGFEPAADVLGGPWEGRLFFGFAKKSKTLEAISWNREQGRFDFFVASPIGPGEKPKLFEVKQRSNCTSCHQSNGPIFPPQPWTEMVNHDPRKKFLGAKPNAYVRPPAIYALHASLMAREQTPFPNNAGLAIGIASFTGNRLLQASTLMRTVCGDDATLRRLFVLAALNNPFPSQWIRNAVGKGPGDFDFDFALPNTRLKTLLSDGKVPKALVDAFGPSTRNPSDTDVDTRWPKNSFAYPNEFIPDMAQVLSGAVTAKQSDPRTPRPQVNEVDRTLLAALVHDVAFDVLGFRQEDALRITATLKADTMARLFAGNDDGEAGAGLRKLIDKKWPPASEEILKAIGAPEASTTAPESTAPPIAEITAPNSKELHAAGMKAFGKHCITCHKVGGTAPEVPFHDETKLLKYESERGGEVAKRIRSLNMPPVEFTTKNGPPTTEERRAMLAVAGVDDVNSFGPVRRVPNQFGAEVRAVAGLKYSYVLPPRVAPVREGWIAPCSERRATPLEWTFRKELRPAAMPALLASDKRWYPSLDRFPTHLPGTLRAIRSMAVLDEKTERCVYIALTRAGNFVSLGYDSKVDAFGTVPMTNGTPTVTGFTDFDMYPGQDRDWGIAIDSKGFLQVVTVSASQETLSFTTTPLAIPENIPSNTTWRRASIFVSDGKVYIGAETKTGATFVLNVGSGGKVSLTAGTGLGGPVPEVPWQATVGADGLLFIAGQPVDGAAEALR